MAKFHINDKGEVKPCNAKVHCRFGGESGSDNHFISKADAEAHIQEEYAKKYSPAKGLKKPNALNKLVDKGMKVNKINNVTEYDFKNITNGDSTVDVLDEKPTLDWLKDVRNNGFKL